MTLGKISAVFLVSMLFFGASLAQADDVKTKLTLNITAASPTYDEAYILTVPADFTITQSGWNSVGNINIKHDPSVTATTFNPAKKVVVTVASQNGGLRNGNNVIAYTIKTTASDTEAVNTFEFSADEINNSGGTNKAIGVDVADYSSMPEGDYEDYITYTAQVIEASYSVGNQITFGTYDSSSLMWRVLAVDAVNNRALLVTENAVAEMKYQASGSSNKWSESDLKTWLNGTGDSQFMKEFTDEEKARILKVSIPDGDNSDSSGIIDASGSDTVFLLSAADARTYFADNPARVCKYDTVAYSWWLRSPASDGKVACVNNMGNIDASYGIYAKNNIIYVRPALWISLQ